MEKVHFWTLLNRYYLGGGLFWAQQWLWHCGGVCGADTSVSGAVALFFKHCLHLQVNNCTQSGLHRVNQHYKKGIYELCVKVSHQVIVAVPAGESPITTVGPRGVSAVFTHQIPISFREECGSKHTYHRKTYSLIKVAIRGEWGSIRSQHKKWYLLSLKMTV